jgi:hypothetical protein
MARNVAIELDIDAVAKDNYLGVWGADARERVERTNRVVNARHVDYQHSWRRLVFQRPAGRTHTATPDLEVAQQFSQTSAQRRLGRLIGDEKEGKRAVRLAVLGRHRYDRIGTRGELAQFDRSGRDGP